MTKRACMTVATIKLLQKSLLSLGTGTALDLLWAEKAGSVYIPEIFAPSAPKYWFSSNALNSHNPRDPWFS